MASLASTYNELLLKKNRYATDINLMNMYLYGFSILFNVLILILYRVPISTLVDSNRIWIVLVLSVISSFGGLVTSRVIQQMSTTTKAFAMGCELIITTGVASHIFGIRLTKLFSLAFVSMLVGAILYNSRWFGGTKRTNMNEVIQSRKILPI